MAINATTTVASTPGIESTTQRDKLLLAMPLANLFADLPTPAAEEDFHDLLVRDGTRIERIVSHGHCSAEGFWYEQGWGEWVIVLQGQARLELADPPRHLDLGPGDFIDLPAGTRHRVASTTPDEPTVWLAVHYGEGKTMGKASG